MVELGVKSPQCSRKENWELKVYLAAERRDR
jgi:hypothetical protein